MAPQFQFDPNLDFQLEAIRSVADLFEGLPPQLGGFSIGEEIVPNPPLNSRDWLHANLLAVQDHSDPEGKLIPRSLLGLEVDNGFELDGVTSDSWDYPNFTIEMETGTGKTYVYLRTIYELRRRYGFSKFVIVVPSIAIYEGVIKNFQITQTHLRALYANETVNLYAYDSSQISRLRSFATSTFVEVLVITLDSFNKATNVIYKTSEKLPGDRKPYQFIQETNPVLILDEPQNMGSERAKQALRTLHPLFALRYSATHRECPNLIYRLTPFEAFRRRLVKKISVCGITERENYNQPFLALESISKQQPWTAKVRTYITQDHRTREELVTLKQGDDLFKKTSRPEHRAGYKIVNIHAGEKYVEFENGLRLRIDETIGPNRPAIFRQQIRETIQRHLDLQAKLRAEGVKVLSLFFIDRVANYTDPTKAIIRDIFDQEFQVLKHGHPDFDKLRPEDVRRAYFAKKKTAAGEVDVDTRIEDEDKTQADKEAEKAAFRLIMRQKEQLLSLAEPVSFIFAHSALKEGWDNPNVFQICTLNQTVSEIKKRQEIGRGLRLPVNQDLARIHDDEVNILTVVANESYESYAGTLQAEYREAGESDAPPVSNARALPVLRNDAIFHHAEFRKFWEHLSQHSTYQISLDTDQLVSDCIIELNKTEFPTPVLVIEKGTYVQTEYSITLQRVIGNTAHIAIDRRSTDGSTLSRSDAYQKGNDLVKVLHDERLRGFTIVAINPVSAEVTFERAGVLSQSRPIHFQTEAGVTPTQRAIAEAKASYPVPDLLSRTAQATRLTRPTINRIFRGIQLSRKQMFLKNPEGFASKFIDVVTEVLANHVANRIQFTVSGKDPIDLDKVFAPKKEFKPHGLTDAGDKSLYNQIQTESDIEQRFLCDRLKPDPKIVFFFKFPDGFKIRFPKIIGDYIPDWGIVRHDDTGKLTLQLVRETKGSTDLRTLRFPAEKRKIVCAKKHFDSVAVDYRPIKDDTLNWWLPEPDQDAFKI